YKPISFIANQTVNGKRVPVYHTNVMMCLGKQFAVVCLDTLDKEEERKNLKKSLLESGKELIGISEQQMNHFAANMLQVKSREGLPYLVMSGSAFEVFSTAQLEK